MTFLLLWRLLIVSYFFLVRLNLCALPGNRKNRLCSLLFKKNASAEEPLGVPGIYLPGFIKEPCFVLPILPSHFYIKVRVNKRKQIVDSPNFLSNYIEYCPGGYTAIGCSCICRTGRRGLKCWSRSEIRSGFRIRCNKWIKHRNYHKHRSDARR